MWLVHGVPPLTFGQSTAFLLLFNSMAKQSTLVVTEELIRNSLPSTPRGYSYIIEKHNNMWWKVSLLHLRNYDYKGEEKVKTVYGFVKRTGVVHAPIDPTRPNLRKVVCQLVDLKYQSSYSVINPKVTSLPHLL